MQHSLLAPVLYLVGSLFAMFNTVWALTLYLVIPIFYLLPTPLTKASNKEDK